MNARSDEPRGPVPHSPQMIQASEQRVTRHHDRPWLSTVALVAVAALSALTFGVNVQSSALESQNLSPEEKRAADAKEALKVPIIRAVYGDPVLAGAIDFHSHTGPDVRPRIITDMELAREARKAGMRAIVLKQHWVESADRAQMVMDEVPGIQVFGGIVLNRAVGGINPDAVRAMLGMEGKRGRIVWMPTVDAESEESRQRENRPAVPIMKDGKLVPELAEVLKLIAENNLVLETGHLSPDESVTVLTAAKQAGVRRMVVTHARTDQAHMERMVAQGAFLECIYNDISVCSSRIKATGAQHWVLGTDLGGPGRPIHTDGMKTFIMRLRSEGISQDQIDLMVRRNPARLLGLDPW